MVRAVEKVKEAGAKVLGFIDKGKCKLGESRLTGAYLIL